MPWALTLAAVGLVSAASLIGAVVLSVGRKVLDKGLLILISFAAGALFGDAFLHLIPEISESRSGFGLSASIGVLGGILGFFVLEKLLHWHHSHLPGEDVLHPVAVTNLVGDALHNFLDGIIVAGGFLVSPKVGFATAVAVALHEIPQEIGDFAILLHAGMTPKKALMINFLTALTAVGGAVATLLVSSVVTGVADFLLPVSAGGFIYVAGTDLFPELHKESQMGKSLVQLASLLAGVLVMASLLFLE